MQFCNLQRMYEAHAEEFNEALIQSASAAEYIGGRHVLELEKKLADFVGRKHALACANGTDALVLALRALEVGPGDYVACPAFSFFATAEAINRVGAIPVFIDVDSDSFILSEDSLKEALHVLRKAGQMVKAAIVVDTFGQLARAKALTAFSNIYGFPLIENASQSFGARLGKKRACSFGDISTTSFYPTKPLACFGDGGMVFCDNERYLKSMRSLALHGSGNQIFEHMSIGINSRLDDLQAAVLAVKFKYFEEEFQKRQELAQNYEGLLSQSYAYAEGLIKLPELIKRDDSYSAWDHFTLRFENSSLRDFVHRELKNYDVPTHICYPKTLEKMPVYEDESLAHCPVSLENAHSLSQTILSLPFDPYMTNEELALVVSSLDESVKNYKNKR
ncbi:MAG: DegT/DnrJ/EryC1/StrS aminotransferase family protein [Coriobacteriia bacterium]|nr:DegT/DnrJ/EryC1/StrS aminotransferase family protein [Coriobacteriia bacterium]